MAGGLGDPLGDAEAVVVVVVVAGDIPGTVAETNGFGVTVAPGAAGAVAGLVAVVGGPGGLLAGAGGGGWPNEVSARVTEKKLAISSVFIGLIKELSRP